MAMEEEAALILCSSDCPDLNGLEDARESEESRGRLCMPGAI